MKLIENDLRRLLKENSIITNEKQVKTVCILVKILAQYFDIYEEELYLFLLEQNEKQLEVFGRALDKMCRFSILV